MNPEAIALAFALGVVAGLRSMTAPAAITWAGQLKWIHLDVRAAFVPWAVTLLALGEIVNDKLPKTPSRKAPGPFIARLSMGAASAGLLASGTGTEVLPAAVAGALGAVVGTLGGYEVRTRAVKALKVPDYAIALIEDAVAVGGALFVVTRF